MATGYSEDMRMAAIRCVEADGKRQGGASKIKL